MGLEKNTGHGIVPDGELPETEKPFADVVGMLIGEDRLGDKAAILGELDVISKTKGLFRGR